MHTTTFLLSLHFSNHRDVLSPFTRFGRTAICAASLKILTTASLLLLRAMLSAVRPSSLRALASAPI